MLYVKRFNGEIISRSYKSHSRQFLDQLSDKDDIWVCSGVLSQYLRKHYDISVKDYFNIIMHGDVRYSIKCSNPKCNNNRKFISISKGYSKTCGDKSCISYMSSQKAIHQHSDPNSKLNISLNLLRKDKSHIDKLSSNMRKMNNERWKDKNYIDKMSKMSYETINNWRSKSISKYKTFILNGNLNDECIFYLGLTKDNTIKFGITSSNLDKGRCNRKWRLDLKSIHRVVIGNRLKIAKIELELKLYLRSNSEYVKFEYLNKIINFIRNNV